MYIHTCMYMYKPYHVGTMSQHFGAKMLNIHVYMYMYICIKRRIPLDRKTLFGCKICLSCCIWDELCVNYSKVLVIRLLVIKGFTLNAEIAKISISENN